MIFWTVDSFGSLSVLTWITLCSFKVDAKTVSCSVFSTGTLSPVMLASLRLVDPLMMVPSTGTCSPTFTMTTSPTSNDSTGTTDSFPSCQRIASFGARFKRDVRAFSLFAVVYVSNAPLTEKMRIKIAPSEKLLVEKAPNAAKIINISTLSTLFLMVSLTPSWAL